jgi:protein TonB
MDPGATSGAASGAGGTPGTSGTPVHRPVHPRTTLIESKAKPFGSSRGAIVSFAIHATLIAAAIFATTEVVLPPREKVEAHPVLYVATPPPKPLEQPPAPLPKAPPPPKSKSPEKVYKAPPAQPKRAETPRPVPQVQPKAPTTPALVAPTKIAVSLPPVDLKAPPTVSDVVVPSASEVLKSSGIGTGGTVKRDAGDAGGGSGRGLNSGSAGKAYDENQVDRAVEITRKVDPRYPDALRSVNVEGVVVMRFIVGTDGRVESGSIQVVSSPNKLFSDAVRNALMSTRYRPAEAGGDKVRQLVEQQFAFRLSQ